MIKKYFSKIFSNRVQKFRDSLPQSLIVSGVDNECYSEMEIYHKNVIVHRCVNLIASSFCQIKWELFRKTAESTTQLVHHPLSSLLSRPNYQNNLSEIFFTLITHMLVYGNGYLLLEKYGQDLFLDFIDPNSVNSIVQEGFLVGYRYRHKGKVCEYYLNDYGDQSVLHFQNHQIHCSKLGVSSLETISKAIILYSKILEWNHALLKHSSKPSGTLSFKDGYNLTQDQFERLKEQFYENFSGASNSGKPIILEGSLEWKDLEKHQKLEKFLELKDSIARDIALAFNVPVQLLGIKGDNTYNNMKEARLSLWEENIIPLANRVFSKLSHWFSCWFREQLILSCDWDSISALNEKRENLWSKVSSASFMTINEKRAIFNLPKLENGDSLDN